VRHPLEEIDDNLACEILKVTESKKKDNKHNMYDNPEVMDFMKSIYKNMKGHFTGLRIDGELAIYAITIYGKSSHHLFTLSYNRTYQNLNLGTLLLNYEITQLPFEKLHYYSMGTGMDIYKLKFATQLQPLYQLVGAGSSIKGKLISKFSHHRAQKQEKAMLNEIERHCEIPLRSVFL
jgi:CelD/BcsL family acetyltransferase involved in cellulose biosynthesis